MYYHQFNCNLLRDVEDAVPYKTNRCYVIRFMYYLTYNRNVTAGVEPPPYVVDFVMLLDSRDGGIANWKNLYRAS